MTLFDYVSDIHLSRSDVLDLCNRLRSLGNVGRVQLRRVPPMGKSRAVEQKWWRCRDCCSSILLVYHYIEHCRAYLFICQVN